jgi:hypothetical protein
VTHVEYTLARTRHRFDNLEAYLATAHSLRDRLIEARPFNAPTPAMRRAPTACCRV